MILAVSVSGGHFQKHVFFGGCSLRAPCVVIHVAATQSFVTIFSSEDECTDPSLRGDVVT